MFDVVRFIKKRLARKILLALTIGIAIVMGISLSISVKNQREQIRESMTNFGHELKYLAYASIKHPMSVGDSASVEKQLIDIKEALVDTEIVICDFNQLIIFATHEKRINDQVSEFIHSKRALAALTTLFDTENPSHESFFEEEVDGKKYLVTIHSIANDPECHHCHGASRKVLGGLLTRHSTDATYAAIASLRNRTLSIIITGIVVLISIIYYLLARMVTGPVSELADKATKLAQGDLSVSVKVKTEDSIGVLGQSFNSMVKSIKDKIEFANSLKEAIADPLFMVNTKMVITYMNDACAKITGYSKEEAVGKLTCRDIFKSDLCDTHCPVRYSSETGKPVEGIRVSITNRAGVKIPVMTSANALKDAHGTIIGAVEICKDITEVLEAERLRYIKKTAAREEEQRKHLETRAASLLETLSRVSGGNLKVRAEVTAKNEVMDKIAQHANKMLDNLEKLYEKISSFSKKLEHEVASRTMMLRERTLLLERANRELMELDRLKSSFLANMSHELRTPMNSIIGYTDLLLDGIDGEINDEQEKSLQKVCNNARHLLELINDILDMSKIESGKVELDLSKIKLEQLIDSITPTFEPAMQAKQLSLSLDYHKNMPRVYVDEDKVRQIFNNLLSNAFKFTSLGGVIIHIQPSTQGVEPGEPPLFAEVCIEDTGIGIKKNDIGKLFDKFSQIDVSTSRQYEGTGLGLSIARGLVVLHKGVIWAESKFGKGTKLCFTLPIKKELLDKTAEPVIEPIMAEKLGQYFNKPAKTFMQAPTYGGKPVRCWEYTHCGQISCPAYGSNEHRCWLMPGTHCKGVEVSKCPEKAKYCKGCEIIENLVLENNTIHNVFEPEKKSEARALHRQKNVLAIDDNPEVIELIRKNIGNDYNVVGLLNGEKAVAEARAMRPDIITLDIIMPRKDGWQVLQELKNTPETRDIPVIILSIVDDKRMGFSLGAAEYLVKPIDKQLLLQKLQHLEKGIPIKKVLVVDNEAEAIDLISGVLKEAGCRVCLAYSSQDAIAAIDKSKPDLVILNLTMPCSDGFDLIEYMKVEEEIKDIPLMLITPKDLSEDEIKDFNGRIQITVNKGIYSEEDLLEELKRTIAKL